MLKDESKKSEAKEVAAVMEKMTEEKKWLLYGFALGLKANAPFVEKTAV
jgi:hypothetical protein